jgi:hypothetical protein
MLYIFRKKLRVGTRFHCQRLYILERSTNEIQSVTPLVKHYLNLVLPLQRRMASSGTCLQNDCAYCNM